MTDDARVDTADSSDARVEPIATRFAWPPSPLPDETTIERPADAAVNDPAPARRSRWREYFRDAESFWLAPRSLPLARRAEEASWAPDPADAFCNRCAQSIGYGEDDEFGCAKCRDRKFAWVRAVRLGEYERDLAAWLKDVKFARNASLGVELGRVLGGRLVDAGLPRARVCVVPIPMSGRERVLKGFDHARVIGEGVARGLGAPLVNGLTREHRPSQRTMDSVTARERNVRRAFRAARGVDLSGWTVVLVDDVMTTGATMRAASKALWPRRQDLRPDAIWAAAVGVTPERPGTRREGREPGAFGGV